MRLRTIGVLLLVAGVALFLAVWWGSVDVNGVWSSEDRLNYQFLVATAIVGYFPTEAGPRSAVWFVASIASAVAGLALIAIGPRSRRT